MTEPLMDEDLDRIRERAANCARILAGPETKDLQHLMVAAQSAVDVPALLAEVQRQRASARRECTALCGDLERDRDQWEQRATDTAAQLHAAEERLRAIGNVKGCLCSWSTLTDGPEQVNDACPHHGGTWRQYTVERDSSDDGVSVLCREDGDCMENSGEDGVAFGRYLTLGEAVDWAKAHAVSIFHVDPDACDSSGHDPIECSCELTPADAYPNGRDAVPAVVPAATDGQVA